MSRRKSSYGPAGTRLILAGMFDGAVGAVLLFVDIIVGRAVLLADPRLYSMPYVHVAGIAGVLIGCLGCVRLWQGVRAGKAFKRDHSPGELS